MSNRRGIIKVGDDVMQDNPKWVTEQMKAIGFLPQHKQTVYDTRSTDYYGTSQMFEELKEGDTAPYYDMTELLKRKEQDNAK